MRVKTVRGMEPTTPMPAARVAFIASEQHVLNSVPRNRDPDSVDIHLDTRWRQSVVGRLAVGVVTAPLAFQTPKIVIDVVCLNRRGMHSKGQDNGEPGKRLRPTTSGIPSGVLWRCRRHRRAHCGRKSSGRAKEDRSGGEIRTDVFHVATANITLSIHEAANHAMTATATRLVTHRRVAYA